MNDSVGPNLSAVAPQDGIESDIGKACRRHHEAARDGAKANYLRQ